MEPIVQIFLSILVFLPASLLVLRSGWLCLRYGRGILTPPQHLGLLALSIFKGEDAAAMRKKELIEIQKRKVTGYEAVFSGSIALLISITLFIEAILRL